MPGNTPSLILLISGVPDSIESWRQELAKAGVPSEIDWVPAVSALEGQPQRPNCSAVLLDNRVVSTDETTLARVRSLTGKGPYLPIIVLTEAVTVEQHQAAIAAGASDLVPFDDSPRLALAVWRACEQETVRRQHEADLRHIAASERRFATMFNASPIATLVTEIDDGTIVNINPAVESLFGLSRAEIIGRQSIEFGAWSDLAQRRRLVADALFSGSGHSIEREIQLPNGQRFVVLFSFCAIDLDGKSRLLVMLQDITSRKAAEDTLRESEERYRLLVENSHDLICEINQDGELCYASPNHQAIAGYLPDELLGQSVWDFLPPDDQTALSDFFANFEGHTKLQLRFRHRQDHWLTFDSSLQVHRIYGGERRAVVISRDISASLAADATRHTLEQQLRQAQKMEAIGTLAGGIAHDFNNILTAIFGYLQLVQLETPDDSPVREELTGALEASERARDLVSQILTFSRRREQQRALGKIAPIINDAMRLLRASLPATIDFKMEIDETAPPILCDATQIHQVLMNLGTNAGHAMRDHGGLLTVRLTQGRSDPSLFGSYPQLAKRQTLCLSVSDTGHGMDPATRERIFEPFFTTKLATEGTGLGLAVVHGIVQDHDGAIVCDSAAGVGTSFRIYFPTVDLASLEIAMPPADLPQGNGERVLLVDDEQSVVTIGSRMIKRLGYQVESFTDAPAAIDRFTHAPQDFDIVVTDLTMGGATGVDMARRVFELRPGLPLIIATGFMNARDVDTARALGVRWFLEKPFSFQGLALQLKKALQLRK